MEWLKEHAYLATWLSPLIAVIGIMFSARKAAAKGQPVEWTRVLLMVLCLSSFPIVVTPTFDSAARTFGQLVFFFTLAAFLVRRE